MLILVPEFEQSNAGWVVYGEPGGRACERQICMISFPARDNTL